MTNLQIALTVAVIALTTAALRFLPFLIWSGGRRTPPLVEKLGRMLPTAIMGMLVVYCLKEIRFTETAGFVPQLVACLVVAALHIWKRNTLVSIVAGTVCYMVLVQMVF